MKSKTKTVAVCGMMVTLAVVVMVLVSEPMDAVLWITIKMMAVVTCMIYDFVLPRAEFLLQKQVGK